MRGGGGGYRHLYCMIHDPEASGFLALYRSLLSTTTASYMRSDITCATLREYFSWATATADLEFGSLLSHESDLRTRSHNYAYRQVVPRNCNLSMLHQSSSGYNPEDMDIV